MSAAEQSRPKPPENLGKLAADRARILLAGRLQRGGIATSRPEWYFQVEAAEPQAYRGGWQVRVHTWRHWSDARIHLNADTGEAMYCCVDHLADPATTSELSQPEALALAAKLIPIPPDARLRTLTHEQFAEGYKVTRLEWDHYHRELRVDGDYLWVQIHPVTHRLVAYGRKWRVVRPP